MFVENECLKGWGNWSNVLLDSDFFDFDKMFQ
jgi:hypothetical protein